MNEREHRVLPVTVDAWTIMDMNGPVCDVGESVEFILEFREENLQDAATSEPAGTTVTVDAYAQEYPGTGALDPARMSWDTLLSGDGWSARWEAPRPVLGRVRLTGRFFRESLSPHETRTVPTRGRLTRIRTWERSGPTEDVSRIWKAWPDADVGSFLAEHRAAGDDLRRYTKDAAGRWVGREVKV